MWPEYDSPSSCKWGFAKFESQPASDGARPPLLAWAGRMLARDPRLFRKRLWRFFRTYGRRGLLALSPVLRQPPCSFPWTQVQIFENGHVLLCCQGVTEIGDLRPQSFEEIWRGAEAQRYRAGLLEGR